VTHLGMAARFAASLAALVVLSYTPQASAQAAGQGEPTWYVGGAVGVLFGGTISTDYGEVGTTTGYTARLNADYFLVRRFSFGLLLQASGTETEGGASASVVAIGPSLTAHLGNLDAFHFRATVGIQYQMTSVDAVSGSGITGLGIPFSIDLVFPTRSANLFGQVGFISQPTGGNSASDVAWKPMFYLAVGGEFMR
jgi:hypothetical protein